MSPIALGVKRDAQPVVRSQKITVVALCMARKAKCFVRLARSLFGNSLRSARRKLLQKKDANFDPHRIEFRRRVRRAPLLSTQTFLRVRHKDISSSLYS